MLRSITAFDKSFATEMSFRLAPFDIQRLILGRGSSTFAVSFRSEFPVSLKYKNPFSVFCNECKNETTPAPILIASEWDKIAGNEFLCAGCLEDRGVSKGNPITLPSLAPCTYNLIFPNYTDSGSALTRLTKLLSRPTSRNGDHQGNSPYLGQYAHTIGCMGLMKIWGHTRKYCI